MTSEAVTVAVPAVFRVTLRVLVPATSAALAGSAALASLEVMATVSFVLTRFQLASTEFTVTLNAVPAVCALAVPVLPVAVPGATVSPGARICSFARAPAFTVIDELVLAVLVPSVVSVAVTVALPAVFKVTPKVFVPATKAAFAGKLALLSEEVIATVSVAVFTRFQLASTALTLTLNAVPAVCAVGVPVLPVALPGAAVSPGARICSFANEAALTAMRGEVLAETPAWVTSEPVTVELPAVFSVKVKLRLPATSAALLGKAAFASLEVIATVSLVFTTFQFASTELTVTVKAVPAVWAEGVPIFPEPVPGAAVSPGVSNCNLTSAPALTVIVGLVLLVLLPSVKFVAVRVEAPAVLSVTLKVFVPLTRAVLAGREALLSEAVSRTVSPALLTKFQFASTALTVTLNAVQIGRAHV